MKYILLWLFLVVQILPQGYGSYGQNKNAPRFYYTYTPVVDTAIIYESQNLVSIINNRERTKSDKDSGGTRFYDYTKIWRDSTTELVTNGYFDTDRNGWTKLGEYTLAWSSNYGGTMRANMNSTGQVVYQKKPLASGTYRVKALIRTTSYSSSPCKFRVDMTGGVYRDYDITGTGLQQIDWVMKATVDNEFTISLTHQSLNNITVYLDSISITPLPDSVSGRYYTRSIVNANDSTWYWWQYYGYWKQKDGDTVWVYSDIDSFYTPRYYDCQPNVVDFVDITDAELNTVITSSPIVMSGFTCDSIRLNSTTAEYRIGANGSWNLGSFYGGSSFYVSNGDTVWLRITSSDEYFTTTYSNLYVHSDESFTITWNVTTKLPLIPTRVIISDDAGDDTHRENTRLAFIAGYECAGATWQDSIWVYNNTLQNALIQGSSLSTEIVIRSTTGLTSYTALAESYAPDIMTFMPAGSNSHIKVYDSGGNLPDLIVTGAGDVDNEIGYDIEFYSPDPITGEPDLSSFSNAYIAGIMMYLADTLNVSLWNIRDTLRTRLGDSWTSENGYGLVNCNLVTSIINGEPITPPSSSYPVNTDGGKILLKGGINAIKFKD